MVYGRRKYRRTARGRRFRRSYARRTRRSRRRSYRRRTRTISSVVKLTYDAVWTFYNGTNWPVFSFSPLSLPGFRDYQTTYTHFRILKAKLFINRQMTAMANDGSSETVDGSTWNYLVVGSRPFAATRGPLSSAGVPYTSYVPPQVADVLRQTRWQRVHYPSTTTQRVTAGFYPYTMVGTFGPALVTSGTNVQYQRIWEGRRWMPFNWALDETGGPDRPIGFFGPYIVADTPTGTGSPDYRQLSANCTLSVSVQFKGQR